MHKELFYPLPCVWNVQLNDAADLSVCSHSRSANGKRSDEQPNAKLLHMNREDKLEYNDDERLMIADVPETENVVEDRLLWYLFERKQITLLNGYNFVDLTTQISHEALEKIYQQINSNVKLPTSLLYCTEDTEIRGLCGKKLSVLQGTRTHAYFVDLSNNQMMPNKLGISLAVHSKIDGIPRLETLSMLWSGPMSVAICASDREAFRLPLLLRSSLALSERKNIFYHVVYTNKGACATSFAYNAAVAFSLTSHVLILRDEDRETEQQLLTATLKDMQHDKMREVINAKSTAFIVFEQTKEVNMSARGELHIRSCQSRDKSCQLKQLKRASAVLLPVEISLVPPDASADSFFDFLLWNLLNAVSDTYAIVPMPLNLSANVRERV
uniref:Uncharacterized protein n=1 Tax=Schistocephalus solidus TaxID=70667 RepID=A0A0X3P823_SCHSO